MSKRGSKGTPEQEIFEVISRMRKYPEALKSAKFSGTWHDFLDDVGIFPQSHEDGSGYDFWDKVRQGVKEKPTWREPYRKEGINKQGEKWKQVSYRDKTGKFISREALGIPRPIKKEPTEKQLLEANVYKSYSKSGRFMGYRDYETGKIKKVK